jgi:hypothetical protein
LYLDGKLPVSREYQRGTKWRLPQKQALVDSLLRGYQIPLFYVHIEKTTSYSGGVNENAWLVDGQQRLVSITDYIKNRFPLPAPEDGAPRAVTPTLTTAGSPWAGKTFDELTEKDRTRLLGLELHVVEMHTQDENEARDLFIRLQAGTPLTAQEKRDAWPGDFTTFVIRHAGKPEHPDSNPKPFFQILPHATAINIDDGDHYVDRWAERRKFFAGLAMTIMLRERSDSLFVDLKGKQINQFYMGNLKLRGDDPGTLRVVRMLDAIPKLQGFERLLAGSPVTHQMAFHLALLVDALLSGDYTPDWRANIVSAFIAFREEVTEARHRHRTAHETSPAYEGFAALTAGSGSDTADVIQRRHGFFLKRVYPAIKVVARDGKRAFDALDKEWIFVRDKGTCQCCKQPVSFRDAAVHHVIEHAAGGQTVAGNGILVCSQCHSDRKKMQELTPQFQEYLVRLEQRTEAAPLRTSREVEDGSARGTKTRTNPPTELRIGADVIGVTKANQIPVEVANWILRQGKALHVIPNVLHQANAGFPLAAQPKQIANGWFVEVGDSQKVLIQRGRRLLDNCDLHDVSLQVVLRDGTVKTA